MLDRLVNIHYEIIRHSAGKSPEIAEGIGDALLRHTSGRDLGDIASAMLAGNRDEAFDLLEKMMLGEKDLSDREIDYKLIVRESVRDLFQNDSSSLAFPGKEP